MTFEQILAIMKTNGFPSEIGGKTVFQWAADMHAELERGQPVTVPVPRPANWSAKARKARGPNKPKPISLSNGAENQDVN